MFCQKCGTQIPDGSAFCTGCGQPVAGANVQNQGMVNNAYQNNQQVYGAPSNYGAPQPSYNNYGQGAPVQGGMQYGGYTGQANTNAATNPLYVSIANKVRSTEMAVNIFWIVLGVLQILLALSNMSYIFVAIAGIWNIGNAAASLKNLNSIVAGNPIVVSYFEQRKTGLIAILVVNLIIGGVIGVILAVVNLINRNYVLNNRMAFESN
jgi:hypothetical protein